MKQLGFGAQHRHRPERRGARRAAFAGVEAGSASSAPSSRSGIRARPSRIGIGQGYNAYTPVQLAQAMATLADERRDVPAARWSPTSTIRAPASARSVEPELVRQVPLKREYVDFVKRAMAGVNKEGTGARAFARRAATPAAARPAPRR